MIDPTVGVPDGFSHAPYSLEQYDNERDIRGELGMFHTPSFRSIDFSDDAKRIAPMWLWTQSPNRDMVKEIVLWDDRNKTTVVLILDYCGQPISYKRRRFQGSKWVTAAGTHPNKQCYIFDGEGSEVYIVEGHHDMITFLLLGVSFLMVPTQHYKEFRDRELAFLSGKNVCFLPDMKKGEVAKNIQPLAEQLKDHGRAKSIKIQNLYTLAQGLKIDYDPNEGIDPSDIVERFDESRLELDGLTKVEAFTGLLFYFCWRNTPVFQVEKDGNAFSKGEWAL